jgi:hypothetical protein
VAEAGSGRPERIGLWILGLALGPLPIPFSANVPLVQTVVPFSYTFTGTEPAGAYFAYAGIAVAGSDPLQPANQLSVTIRAFQFTPTLAVQDGLPLHP